ncbi:MAG: DpnD/PcfM family protein [Paludibacter sp.]|nr:DpnD/PcfM family protein [Paludibacter sp.]
MSKKKFKIEITEILQRVVEIEAENIDIAIENITQKYKSEEIVLDWNDYIEANIDIFADDKLFQNNVNNIEFRNFVLKEAESMLIHLNVEELSKFAFGGYVNAIKNFKRSNENKR